MTGAEPSTWEGAGVVSSYADLSDALTEDRVDPLQVAFAAAGAGIDTLGVVVNPLDSLFAAGIGWLIEHVDFLSDPLDALAGDPAAVLEQARAWQGISAELGATAIGYRHAAAAVAAGWDGADADAYAGAVDRCTAALDRSAEDAAQLADVIVSTGAGVGLVRALIRDTIAKFLSGVIQWLAAAVAAAAVTAGFSLAALVAAVVEQAISLARTFVRHISDLLEMLDEAGTSARRLGESLWRTAVELAAAAGSTADGIGATVMDPAVLQMGRQIDAAAGAAVARVAGPHVQAGAEILESMAHRVHARRLVEAGKQHTGAEQEQRGWPAAD